MENCLVTKFKVTINNPNLPLLETMQQFTLDAIAASGNSSMTDSQKWALNHFFYQIGAIDNSGVYAKTDILILPIICNDTLNKAFINYKTNTLFTDGPSTANLSFSHHGLITSTTKNIGKFDEEYPRNTNNMYLAMFGTQNGTFTQAFSNGSAQTGYFKMQIYSDNNWVGVRINNNEKFYRITEIQSIGGFIYNVDDGVDKSLLFKDGVTYTPTITGNAYLESPYAFNVSIGHSDSLSNIPIGAWLAGGPLTENEMSLLSSAIYELFSAFLN